MKLYDAAWAPSPRRVRIFLAEKAIQVERVTIDLRAGASRTLPTDPMPSTMSAPFQAR